MHLHEGGLDEESGLAASATTNHKNIQIDISFFRVGNLAQGQAFGLGQQDIVFKLGVNVGGNVLGGAP